MGLVEYSVSDAVATITLNRPPVNALSTELVADIGEAVDRAAAPEVRAVVITGGAHFAAGADITQFQAAFDGNTDPDLAGALASVVEKLESLEKPTIAAINGFALGGGLELAMGADFRYLSEAARVGQPEILLGIIPGAGGTQRLARLAGYQRALEMCLSGRQVDAEEALASGIADKVVPAEELLETAATDAARFAKGPTAAYAAVKRSVAGGFGSSLQDGLATEAEAFKAVFETDDARAGVAAFLAKEKADFSGK
ncbi:MAG: enoyl-CoA hydratase-related protein [Actinomycetota bacterium]